MARQDAKAAGLSNLTFHNAGVEEEKMPAEPTYDLVMTHDAIHGAPLLGAGMCARAPVCAAATGSCCLNSRQILQPAANIPKHALGQGNWQQGFDLPAALPCRPALLCCRHGAARQGAAPCAGGECSALGSNSWPTPCTTCLRTGTALRLAAATANGCLSPSAAECSCALLHNPAGHEARWSVDHW